MLLVSNGLSGSRFKLMLVETADAPKSVCGRKMPKNGWDVLTSERIASSSDWRESLTEGSAEALATLPKEYTLKLGSPVTVRMTNGTLHLPVGSMFKVLWVTPKPDKQNVRWATIAIPIMNKKIQPETDKVISETPEFTSALVAMNRSHTYTEHIMFDNPSEEKANVPDTVRQISDGVSLVLE